MTTRTLIAILAALGSTSLATSQASALYCAFPAIDDFARVVRADNGIDRVSLNCNSTGKSARASGNGDSQRDRIAVNLEAGTYAWAGGYDINRQTIIGCFVEDTTPGSVGVGKACNGQVEFYDVYVENF